MSFQLQWFKANGPAPKPDWLQVGQKQIPLTIVANPRARRYTLRLGPSGVARVCVPRGGTRLQARQFAESQTEWLARQLQRLEDLKARQKSSQAGMEIYLAGEPHTLQIETSPDGTVALFGTERVVLRTGTDLRHAIESHLWTLALKTLPARVRELASANGLEIRRVSVRNQRTRWGSCSARGTISLNWRLVQTPPGVRDYIILHELAHVQHMNHSAAFWREVERLCPEWRAAEAWLKANGKLLRSGS